MKTYFLESNQYHKINRSKFSLTALFIFIKVNFVQALYAYVLPLDYCFYRQDSNLYLKPGTKYFYTTTLDILFLNLKEVTHWKTSQSFSRLFGLEPKLYQEVSLCYDTLYFKIKVKIKNLSVLLLYPLSYFSRRKGRARTCDPKIKYRSMILKRHLICLYFFKTEQLIKRIFGFNWKSKEFFFTTSVILK